MISGKKMIAKILKTKLQREHVILFLVLAVTFLMRLPSLYEPFWYGDEGIFAAVARNLNFGGVLYQTAWDNKPPMIYLTYAAIFKFFSVSMFSLRLVTAIVVLATTACIYEIAIKLTTYKRALIAAFIFGLLTSLRIIEGNLALTEIYMILPISLAMMLAIYNLPRPESPRYRLSRLPKPDIGGQASLHERRKPVSFNFSNIRKHVFALCIHPWTNSPRFSASEYRKFDFIALFIAGFLFAVASLYKQVGAFEAGALGIFLFFYLKSFKKFFQSGIFLTLGFSIPYILTILYFAKHGIVSEYIFGAYTYYQIYLNESPQFTIIVNLLKYLPIFSIITYCFLLKKRKRQIGLSFLVLFWMAFSFLGSYFSGRAYGHYLIQTVPSISLALVLIKKDFRFNREKIIFSSFFFLPFIGLTILLFSTVFRWNPIEQIKYWDNFVSLSKGIKSVDEYNNFFDGNVNTIMGLKDFLKEYQAIGQGLYIWGDYPWLYAITDANNPSRYVTSFHVFGVPPNIGREEVIEDLKQKRPVYIIKPKNSIGNFAEFEYFLASYYTFLFKVDEASVFTKTVK